MKFAILSFTIFGGDFFLKTYMERHLKGGEEKEICRGRILLRRHHNSGMALNMLKNCRTALKIICGSMLLLLGSLWFIFLGRKENSGILLGLSLLLGGGASNFYDRISRGYVIDYFSFCTPFRWLNQIVFNISDLCIFAGAILGIWNCERG
ncbi:signal peptidase II [Lachnospiraceae bacterium 45-W7]